MTDLEFVADAHEQLTRNFDDPVTRRYLDRLRDLARIGARAKAAPRLRVEAKRQGPGFNNYRDQGTLYTEEYPCADGGYIRAADVFGEEET